MINGVPYVKLQKYKGYWFKKSDLIYEFNTGGYTGAWGPEGRLAVLHQKELVLNA
jgi:hypothetical protein